MRDNDKALAGAIGQAVREGRTTCGLTQADVADQIGVSEEFFGRLERGRALPRVQTLVRIVNVLGLSLDGVLAAAPRSCLHLEELPEIRRALHRLRRANPRTIELVKRLIQVMESAESGGEACTGVVS